MLVRRGPQGTDCFTGREPVSKFAAKIMKLVRKAYLEPAFNDLNRNEIAKNHFLKGLLPAIADFFTAADPAITFTDALARARQVEACKNLLHPTATVTSNLCAYLIARIFKRVYGVNTR